MANCKYTITIGGKTLTDKSYEELCIFISNNIQKIRFGNINDLVFSLNKQSEVDAKLRNLSQSTKELESIGIDKITGDFLYKDDSEYISVNDFMKNPNCGLNNPFNMENYTKLEISKLEEGGMSHIDAVNELKQRLNHFEDVAKKAIQIKSIIGTYLAGFKNPVSLMTAVEGKSHFNLQSSVYSSIASQMNDIIAKIKEAHGENAKLIPNVRLSSSLNGLTQKLHATVDLIVIDSEGVPHIYVFKNSEKVSEDWLAVKDQDIDYKLGFYRHMLAANGLSVKDTGLYVVPINIDPDSGDVYFEEIQDRLTPTKSGLNRLTWGSGNFFVNISNFVPITISNDAIISDIKENVLDNMSKAFGTSALQNTRSLISIEEFIKSSRVRESDDYSKGKWMFIDTSGTIPKTVYIKEETEKTNNIELREKVTKYLENQAKKYGDASEALVKNITKAIRGEVDFGTIYPNGSKPSYLSQILSKYTGNYWDVIDIPKLRDLGILGIMNKQTHQIDFITISYHNGLNTPYEKFGGLGSTMLGKFETDRQAKSKPNILLATNGNIELMKVLFAINEIPDIFNGTFKVGEILAINPSESSATKASQKELLTTFNSLASHIGITNNIASKIEFVDPFIVLQQQFLSSFNELKNTAANTKVRDAMLLSPTDRLNRLQIIDDLISSLEKSYYYITKDPLQYKDSPIANLYINAWETKFYLEGDPFYQSHVLEKYNISSGIAITAPSLIGDNNLKTMNKWIAQAFNKLTTQFNKFSQPFQNKYVRDLLWKDKGYSRFESNTLGSQNRLYDNMIRRDPKTGAINPLLMVKDPWSDDSLSSAEKQFLKKVLLEWNKERYPSELANITSEDSPLLKTILQSKEKSFWIPVVSATTAAKWSQDGFTGVLKRSYNDFKDSAAYFKREFEGIESETSEIKQRITSIRNNQNELFDFFDAMEISEVDAAKRAEYIAARGLDFWTRNLEDATLSFKFMNMRKDTYSEILPKIRALKMAAILYGDETGVDMKNFVEYLENQVKIAIHNQTILNEESQKYAGYVAQAKYLASSFLLGFNIKGLVREHIEGTWKIIIESMSKKFGKDSPEIKDFYWAEKYIYEDISKQPLEITKVELLNRMFRLNNLDINRLAERVRTNKAGLTNFTDRFMFFCNSAPDFRKRMVLLLAKLKHDGIWDAIEIRDEQLFYNWKKDKRFFALASNNTSDPNYGKQKGLYLQLLNDINEKDGLNLKFGDDLPRMYTTYEMTGIKDYSDRTFGFYDHETKMQEERTFVGMLLMQFQTYLSATKSVWFMAPGLYNMGNTVQATDEQSGKLLWLKEERNDKGEPIYVPTTEETGIPMYVNQDSYFEGIAHSMKDIWRIAKKEGWNAAKVSLLTDPVKRANMTHAAMSMSILLAIWGINKYLFELIKKMWEDEQQFEQPSYASAFTEATGQFFQKCWLGSKSDLNPLGAAFTFFDNSEPAAFSVFSKLLSSTGSTILGDMKLSTWLTTNIGVARTFKEYYSGARDVYEYINGEM